MTPAHDALLAFIKSRTRIMAITGAGISAASGIPTYRNDEGLWQRTQPVLHQEFIASEGRRQRYWARSAIGWPPVARAEPNRAHQALAQLETRGKVSLLVTQNVDRLHQRAGHQNVIDLHGRLDIVKCLHCGKTEQRSALQQRLLQQNPTLQNLSGALAPDGDADVAEQIISTVKSPVCIHCGGIPMPDVVFYGGTVPKERVAMIQSELEQCDGLLVVGSSLTVYSAFRFCKSARQLGIPIVTINRGKTRADALLSLKVEQDCGETLAWVVDRKTTI